MTGAGGLIATNYLANNATARRIGAVESRRRAFALAGAGQSRCEDLTRAYSTGCRRQGPIFKSVGSANRAAGTASQRPLAARKELKMGGLAPGTFPSDNARALQTALGINLKIVDGFKGVTEVRLATESGEVDGSCLFL